MANTVRSRIKKIFDAIVYQYPLINKILRNLNKAASPITSFRLRPFGVMRVKLKSGISFFMETNETNSVTKLLFWNGPDYYEYTRIFEILISKCRTFIDVGSNTGYYALLAAKINSNIKVYALEPASAPLHYLRQNVSLNHMESSIQVFELALADANGEIEFYEVDNYQKGKYNLAGSGTTNPTGDTPGKFKLRMVKSTTLDDLVNQISITNIDLVKLDTEGTEHLILKAANKTLTHYRPIIICETLFHVIEPELDKIMRNYNYRFYNFKNGKLFKTESLIRDSDNGVRDCFFVPLEKEDWIQSFVENSVNKIPA